MNAKLKAKDPKGSTIICRNRRRSINLVGVAAGCSFFGDLCFALGRCLEPRIVVVGNEITVRNAQFRLPDSFLRTIQLKPKPLPSLTSAVVPPRHTLVASGDVS